MHNIVVIDSMGKNGVVYDVPDFECILKIVPLSHSAYTDRGSREYAAWRELSAMRKVTDLVRTKVCPNYPMLYFYKIEKNVHNDGMEVSFPYALLLFMEKAACTLCDWVGDTCAMVPKETRTDDAWMSMVFQVFLATYAIQEKYEIIHRDLHWKNVLFYPNKFPPGAMYLYVIKKLRFYVPMFLGTFFVIDFGKNMRRRDMLLQTDIADMLSDSSRDVYLPGDDNRWTSLNVYRSRVKVEDMYHFSHLPDWMQKHGMDVDSIPAAVQDVFERVRTTRDRREYLGVDELLKETMLRFLDPRVGTEHEGRTVPRFVSIGTLVVYQKRLALVMQMNGDMVRLLATRDAYVTVEVHVRDLREASVPLLPPSYEARIVEMYDISG
jgi:hypothetical protein